MAASLELPHQLIVDREAVSISCYKEQCVGDNCQARLNSDWLLYSTA